MKKGVSAVIATILMLIITIALAGMAYMYIAGVFTGVTQGIEVVDSYCNEQADEFGNDTVTLVIKNIGTTPISSFTCVQTSPTYVPGQLNETNTTGDFSNACNSTATTLSDFSIDPGATYTLIDTCYGTGSGRTCAYRLTPPVGKTITASVYCT